MKYCAVYNTADPKIGAVSVGEVLEDWQVKALGDSKVAQLVAEGLLKKIHEEPAMDATAHDGFGHDHQDEGENTPAADDGASNEKADQADIGDDDDKDEGEAELPEPDDLSDIVPEETEAPAVEKPNKRGRGKKNEG